MSGDDVTGLLCACATARCGTVRKYRPIRFEYFSRRTYWTNQMMLLGGGATARCGTVRHGDDVTGQLGGGPRREPVKPVFLFGCEVWYKSNTDPGT